MVTDKTLKESAEVIDGSTPKQAIKVDCDFFNKFLTTRQGFNRLPEGQYFDISEVVGEKNRFDDSSFVFDRATLEQLIRDNELDLRQSYQTSILGAFLFFVWEGVLAENYEFVFPMKDSNAPNGVRPIRGIAKPLGDGKTVIVSSSPREE